ncbi:MAG: metallophosphatase family protein [Paludibacter sp.]|nr:metallophosphatase family protein [Bacteroidales bacterium]MCM1068905.1 metallophosphatase family protein [Prevotella sp.]MCM1353166.1 metallophosphatase family protein [Bacteroides sp.]MCM1442488.1 metallophosphatase family protein [Muribaculum sp.]MCM1481331.1 metallophosphatase family protein [Paludibacter sp.]
MKTIGILSDTHGLLDERVFEHFKDVDEIWHAGDIGTSEVLQRLREFKPTRAVYGNCDCGDVRYSLQEYYRFKVEDVEVVLTHIGGYPHNYNPIVARKLYANPPQLFVCGHSHILKVQYDKSLRMLCVNPGAAGKYGFHTVQTLIRLQIDGERIHDLEIIELDRK